MLAQGWYMETARAPRSLGAIEFHDLLKGKEERALSVLQPMPSLTDDTKRIQSDAKIWLPAAAEAYNISPDIRDYIMVPVIAMPTELPNRNCLAGDSLIPTEIGMIPISDLSKAAAFEVLTKDGKAGLKSWAKTDYSRTLNVNTKSGRTIRVTKNHPFLVLDINNCYLKWQDAGKLQTGDKIIIRTGSLVTKSPDLSYAEISARKFIKNKIAALIDKNGGKGTTLMADKFPKTVTNSLARMLGHLVAEGWIGDKIIFTNSDFELIQDFADCCYGCFGFVPNIYEIKNDMQYKIFAGKKFKIRNTKPFKFNACIYRQEIINWFTCIGLSKCLSGTKEVPPCILKSAPEQIIHFLRAYIEGDGCLSSEQVSMHTKSPKLAKQLQLLLNSLDIINHITLQDGRYTIKCSESSKVVNMIGAISSQRQAMIDTEYNNDRNRKPSRHRRLPSAIRRWAGKLLKQHSCVINKHNRHTPTSPYFNTNGKYYINSKGDHVKIKFGLTTREKDRLTQAQVQKLAITLENLNPDYRQRLENLLGNFVFEEISDISYNKVMEPVYDIETTAGEFVANGIVVHNCVSFSFLELTKFQPMARNIAYRLWRSAPTFIEHINQDFTQAKGINFDAIMKPMKHVKGNLHKVITLTGFDRRKDPALANAILTGERTGYSMGCLVRDYISSCCQAKLSEGGCEHLVYGKPKFILVNGRLAKWNAIDLLPYEISSVSDPAYISAVNPDYIKMFDD